MSQQQCSAICTQQLQCNKANNHQGFTQQECEEQCNKSIASGQPSVWPCLIRHINDANPASPQFPQQCIQTLKNCYYQMQQQQQKQ